MRTTLSPAAEVLALLHAGRMQLAIGKPFRSIDIFSAEFVFGPKYTVPSLDKELKLYEERLANSTDD